MPIKSVNPDVADAINHLNSVLHQTYGDDYSFSVMSKGFTLAQHNMNGIELPTPMMEDYPKREITRFNVTTKGGNTLQFSYNPENSLVVLDLIHKSQRGGVEFVRQTINEKKMLKHVK